MELTMQKTLFKKNLSQFLLCITALSTLLPAFATPTPAAAPKPSRFARIAKKLNLSSDDLTCFLSLSPALLTISFLTKDKTVNTFLRIVAIAPPLLATSLSKKGVDFIAKIPVIKHFFLMLRKNEIELGADPCENKKCRGLCAECKAMPLYTLVLFSITPIMAYFAYQESLLRKAREQEQIKQRQREDFERMYENLERLREYYRQRERNQENEQPNFQAPNIPNHDLYNALGVAQNASEAEVRRAYRRLALQSHPDRIAINNITLEEANRRMHLLNEANEILGDPETRRIYDQNMRINRGINK